MCLAWSVAAFVAFSHGTSAQPLRREIAPVAIERASGEPYLNPFGGGLWQPRIGLFDADRDGRPDLFTLNPDGELRYYRNEGAWRFRRIIPSAYDSVPVSNWFRFADLDGDGAAELLTAGPRSEVMVHDNEGSDESPVFGEARVLRDVNDSTILMQRETVPSLVDIDADGDLDLFTGNLQGDITFYRNEGTATTPRLRFVTSRFEDILVISGGRARGDDRSSSELQASRHGASVLDFADLDGDGDLDLLFGDFFTRKLLHFENLGTATAPDFSMDRLDTAFLPSGDEVESEGFNQPVTGDLDGDGDLDALVSSLYPQADPPPLTLYENVGTVSSPVMRRRSIDVTSELDVGRYAAPALIEDAQRRGLLVGSSAGRLSYLERIDGTARSDYRMAGTLALPGLFQTVPTAGDLDGDGVAEVVVGESNGAIIFHRFAGSELVRYGDNFQLNRNAAPTLVDLDGDGDLDLFSGAENGRFAYFENRGTTTAADFERATPPAPFDRLDVGYDSSPRFFDIDGDGDLDALVGARTGGTGTPRDTLRFFERSVDGFVESEAWRPMLVARNPAPLALRLNGRLTLLVGDLSGGIKAFVDTAGASGVRAESRDRGLSVRASAGTLVIEREAGSAATARVVDVLGRVVRQEVWAAEQQVVRIEGLRSGVYVVEVVAGQRRDVAVIAM